MEQFKICPVCGRRNPPVLLECPDCEADLSAVPLGEEQPPEPAPAEQPMVRTCPTCGAENPPPHRVCQSCGADLSLVRLAPAGKPHFVLADLDGSFAWEVPEGGAVLGREQAMADYLGSRAYVSRRHAELQIREGCLQVKNLSRTNFTYRNNERIVESEFVTLEDGDLLGLGGVETESGRQPEAAYFRVRSGPCT